ncbi:nickel pincer cofactor biosynthesis protein LarC [Archaeoglobus sp.]
MKVAIFDAFNGASGDMILASLLGVGIDEEEIKEVVSSLGIDVSFKVTNVNVKGINAKRVEVEERGGERKFEDVLKIIRDSNLEDEVKENALAIFEIIAKAEGKVHGRDYRESVLHEVGADDAIFDVVCCVKAFENLKKEGYTFFATPIRAGSGFTEFSHGKYPVPAPAVLEILKSSSLEFIMDDEGELLTPTGAAILSHYCKPLKPFPIKVTEVSYGAGKRETNVPNVLRLILGETAFHDSVAVIETNVDDLSGEMLGYAMRKLFERGDVLDVVILPAYGKKMRPVSILKVISPMHRSEDVAREVMRLTGSLGVRVMPVHHRVISERSEEAVKVKIRGKEFEVRVKRSHPGFLHLKPEFDDVVAIAEDLNIPPHVVYREIMKKVDGAKDADSERE